MGGGKEREWSQWGGGIKTERSGGCHRWDVVSPLTQGSSDEQLAMNTCVAASLNTHGAQAYTDADAHMQTHRSS